jgi:hypothetical protein
MFRNLPHANGFVARFIQNGVKAPPLNDLQAYKA